WVDAIVTAVGSPRATSAAKLGPDRIAGTAAGAHSAMISVMNLCVPRSMPLAQATKGTAAGRSFAAEPATARIACAGTTARTASARTASARSRVSPIRSSSFTPGRKRLSRLADKCSEFLASNSHNVTSRPARAQVSASAVTQAPPPSSAMRWRLMPACPTMRLFICSCAPSRALGGGDLVQRPARARCDIHGIDETERPPLATGPRYHRAIVGTQIKRWRNKRGADLECQPVERATDRLICGDATGRDKRTGRAKLRTKELQARAQTIEHDVDNRLLKAGAKIGNILIAERSDLLRLQPQCSLQAGKREIRLLATVHGPRQ